VFGDTLLQQSTLCDKFVQHDFAEANNLAELILSATVAFNKIVAAYISGGYRSLHKTPCVSHSTGGGARFLFVLE
jgi:hypothetical protein